MKKQKVVFFASGEISGTYDPKCFLENFTGDLNEKTTKLAGHDFWMPIECNMFEVRTIDMPDWMEERDYLDKSIELKYNVGYGMPLTFSRIEFRNFSSLGEKYKYFIGWLLEKHSNSKNSFMQSIFTQVKNWLTEESPKFSQPLSMKQFEAAARFCPLYEAGKISTRLYYSR